MHLAGRTILHIKIRQLSKASNTSWYLPSLSLHKSPRHTNRNSVIFPMSSGRRPEKPFPFIGQPRKFCSIDNFAKSSGMSPPMEVELIEAVISLLIFPKRKSAMRPRRFGFPGAHKDSKFRIFQMLEGSVPSKLL